MIQQSYKNKKPTLFFVATPIGNLKDITLRAIETLKEVDVIFAEDTRVAKLLLQQLKINNKIYSSHKYSEKKTINKILNYLNENKNVAFITDRGTPTISDPGFFTANAVIEHGYNVVSIPGPSAFINALVTSGLEIKSFLFYGFLNHKDSIAKKELKDLNSKNEIIILYESPHRLKRTLEMIKSIYTNRKIIISREITKYNEEIFRGTIENALEYYSSVKGEVVIIIDKEKNEKTDKNKLIQEVKKLMKENYTKTDAIKKVANKYNISKNEIYNSVQKEGEL